MPARTGTPSRPNGNDVTSRATSQHPDPAPTIPKEAPPHGAPVRQYLNGKVTGVLLEGMKVLAKEQYVFLSLQLGRMSAMCWLFTLTLLLDHLTLCVCWANICYRDRRSWRVLLVMSKSATHKIDWRMKSFSWRIVMGSGSKSIWQWSLNTFTRSWKITAHLEDLRMASRSS
jgi:hypothetical protein